MAYFGHPVLIVTEGMDAKGRVSGLFMTSFNNQNIIDKFPERRRRLPYWPIKPTPVHPDTKDLLELKDKRLMAREYSYVNSQGSCSIRYDILEPYIPEDPEDAWVLDEESYLKVTQGRDYSKFQSKSWRKEEEESLPPLPESVK